MIILPNKNSIDWEHVHNMSEVGTHNTHNPTCMGFRAGFLCHGLTQNPWGLGWNLCGRMLLIFDSLPVQPNMLESVVHSPTNMKHYAEEEDVV